MNKEFSEPIINRPADDSLILHFTGRGSRREGTLLADLSKKGHHGTLVGSPPWKNTPLGHSALDFDGTDQYVEVADHADFSFGNGTDDSPFSISAWIYMDTVLGFSIISKLEGNFQEWILYSPLSKLTFSIWHPATGNSRGRQYNTTLSAGQWYHIAATYNGVGGTDAHLGMKIYIDGVRRDDTNKNLSTYTAMSNGTYPVHIGQGYASNADGKIDDTRIYKKELTSNEAMKMYQNNKHFYGK